MLSSRLISGCVISICLSSSFASLCSSVKYSWPCSIGSERRPTEFSLLIQNDTHTHIQFSVRFFTSKPPLFPEIFQTAPQKPKLDDKGVLCTDLPSPNYVKTQHLSKFPQDFGCQKTRVHRLSCGTGYVAMYSAVLILRQFVTDRWTIGWAPDHSIVCWHRTARQKVKVFSSVLCDISFSNNKINNYLSNRMKSCTLI